MAGLGRKPDVHTLPGDGVTRTDVPLLRGHGKRVTSFMERHQVAHIRAIAAAAGCQVNEVEVDEGTDLQLRQTKPSGSQDVSVRTLDVQLKSTGSRTSLTHSGVSVQLSRQRFDDFAESSPLVNKILVVMWMPSDPEDWCEQFEDHLALRHRAYWVNIAGDKTSASEPTVTAPFSQVFDDVSLCMMLDRIASGGVP